jgi:hypothetical protein
MKYEIEYHEVPHGAGLFAFPEYARTEYKEFSSIVELQKYIERQEDSSGSAYKAGGTHFGYNFTSSLGGVKIKEYDEPVFTSPSVPEQIMGFDISLEEMARQELIDEIKRVKAERDRLKSELKAAMDYRSNMGHQGGS